MSDSIWPIFATIGSQELKISKLSIFGNFDEFPADQIKWPGDSMCFGCCNMTEWLLLHLDARLLRYDNDLCSGCFEINYLDEEMKQRFANRRNL